MQTEKRNWIEDQCQEREESHVNNSKMSFVKELTNTKTESLQCKARLVNTSHSEGKSWTKEANTSSEHFYLQLVEKQQSWQGYHPIPG